MRNEPVNAPICSALPHVRFSTIALSVLALAVSSGTAAAGTIASATAVKGGSIDAHYCNVANVGNKAIKSVTLEIVNVTTGLVGLTNTCTDLAPNRVCETGGTAAPFAGFCRVTFTGSKKNVRAVLNSANNGTNQVYATYPLE